MRVEELWKLCRRGERVTEGCGRCVGLLPAGVDQVTG